MVQNVKRHRALGYVITCYGSPEACDELSDELSNVTAISAKVSGEKDKVGWC